MPQTRRRLIGSAFAAATMMPRSSRAQANPTMRIGLLSDQTGPWRDLSGPTSYACARLAIADFDPQDFDVEILVGNHKNIPDLAVSIARGWFEHEGVDMVLDGGVSECALALSRLCSESNKVFIATTAASTALTGPECRATTIHWVYDTAMQARSTGGTITRAGRTNWFLLTSDGVSGTALAQETRDAVEAAGGRIVGSAALSADNPAVMQQALASKAEVLGICAIGPAVPAVVRQATSAGLHKTMKLAPLFLLSTQVHALGLEAAGGAQFSEAFYWNLNARTRSFIGRISGKVSLWPNMIQAGAYAGTLHYLKAVQNMGAAIAKSSGAETAGRMKSIPTDDDCFGTGLIRVDGRKLHPAVLFEAKAPADSRHEWDLLSPLAVTLADGAAQPPEEAGCPLVKI
jgi:branched-chain amino acid transport system substrate-binding protein